MTDDIPEALRRDRTTNKAPFMEVPLPLAVRLRDETGPPLPQMIAQRRAQLASPAASLPEKSLEWLPPWGSKT